MACLKPNAAWYDPASEKKLTFTGKKYYEVEGRPHFTLLGSKLIPVPCGGCISCRLANSRDTAIRAVHEASLSDDSCFLTLTYRNEALPPNGSICVKHVQDFMKRLRARNSDVRIRSFGCAEYGAKLLRPHYHICLFNFDFKDKKFWRHSSNDWSSEKWPVYRSEELEELWPFGFSEIGSLTFESAAYVARYVTKKINGKLSSDHYGDRVPERAVARSNRPGLGADWLKLYASGVIASDSVVHKGKELPVPRYYSKKIKEWYPEQFEQLRQKRIAKIPEFNPNNTKARLLCRLQVKELSFKLLKRGYESL